MHVISYVWSNKFSTRILLVRFEIPILVDCRCLEVYGEAAAHSGMLAVALAAAATRAPPSMDYER